MNSREWKPGDVRLIFVEGKVRLFRYRPDAENPWVLDQDYGPYLHSNWTEAQLVETEGRELVLIDPEDREQAGHLLTAWFVGNGASSPAITELEAERMQAALRSLIEPPKPEEPTGLGAVVEDGEGRLWVRTAYDQYPWSHCSGSDDSECDYTDARRYPEIDVVRVLSGSWTPDASGGAS